LKQMSICPLFMPRCHFSN